MIQIDYRPDGVSLERYLMSEKRVAMIQGPRNSGKTTASIMKLFRNALGQRPSSDGWIRRRSIIVRETFAELHNSTIKSWRNWFPERTFGAVKMTNPPTHHIRIPNANGKGGLDWEIIFMALATDDDIRKLNSVEASDAWVNEGWEVGRQVVTQLIATTNRYPNPRSAEGCFMPQVLLDTNGPPLGHWLAYMSGCEAFPPGMTPDERKQYELPPNWDFFVQPPGLNVTRDDAGNVIEYEDNPAAENRRFMAPDYYIDAARGATPEYIQRYLIGRPGSAAEGSPVWHQYREAIHVATSPLKLMRGYPIIIGMDFGRTPAAAICQKPRDLYYNVVGEVQGITTSAKEFCADWLAPTLSRMIAEADPDMESEWEVKIFCDPAGEAADQGTDTTPLREVRAAGFSAVPAIAGLRFGVRRDVMNAEFRLFEGGRPKILISPTCKALIRAANGGYCYRLVRTVDGRTVQAEAPDKRNPNSHIANALEYAITGHDKAAVMVSSGQVKPAWMPQRPPGLMARIKNERRHQQVQFGRTTTRDGSRFR